jgi:ribonuclease-3
MARPPSPDAADRELTVETARLEHAERIVDYRFVDRRWLLTALTHRSWLNEHASSGGHNELLELLGDAVLGLVVVDELVRTSPSAGEGELTVRRAAHVSAEALAPVSVSSGLAALIRAGRGVLASGLPANVAADAVEAVIGAVWRDASTANADALAACTRVVTHLLGAPPQHVVVTAAHAKRELQERLQRLFGRAPDYSIERADGPSHAPSFRADVAFAGHVLGTGMGGNKRAATEAAATAAVAALVDVDDAELRRRLSATPS